MRRTTRSVLAAAAAFLMFGGITGCGGDDKHGKPDEEVLPAGEEGAVGDTVEIGKWQATVSKVTDPAPSPNKFDKADKGNRLVRVDAEVTNLSNSTVTVSECFELEDAKGQTYPETWIVDPKAGTLSGDLKAGESLSGASYFEVPETAGTLVVNFDCDWDTPEPGKIVAGASTV